MPTSRANNNAIGPAHLFQCVPAFFLREVFDNLIYIVELLHIFVVSKQLKMDNQSVKELNETIKNLNGKIAELMMSVEDLRQSNGYLNAAINSLSDTIKKKL